MAFFDVALVFDPERRACDVAFGDDGDLVLDLTPVTPMLISIGSDRRAAPDDPLPEGVTWINMAHSLVARRGWAGDALDPTGARIGSRLWLLDRNKETEETRLLAEGWLAECLAWAAPETGEPARIDVAWVRPGTLAYSAFVEDASIVLRRPV